MSAFLNWGIKQTANITRTNTQKDISYNPSDLTLRVGTSRESAPVLEDPRFDCRLPSQRYTNDRVHHLPSVGLSTVAQIVVFVSLGCLFAKLRR